MWIYTSNTCYMLLYIKLSYVRIYTIVLKLTYNQCNSKRKRQKARAKGSSLQICIYTHGALELKAKFQR